MKIPDKLPIAREEDYHTHYLGKCEDGRQFWAYDTFIHTLTGQEILADDWQKWRKEYILLHTFDADGHHLHTDHWYAGYTADIQDEAIAAKLEEMVGSLGPITFEDIEVRLFQVTIDGIVFGLIPDKDYDMINLEPSSTISFQEPWNGSYYT